MAPNSNTLGWMGGTGCFLDKLKLDKITPREGLLGFANCEEECVPKVQTYLHTIFALIQISPNSCRFIMDTV